jgi:hypothetical protein
MGKQLNAYFPFALAVLLPPVGVMLGAVALQSDRAQGMRLIAVSMLAAIVWVLLFVV